MLAALLSSVHAANLIRFLCEQHFTTHTFPIPTRHSLGLRYDPQQLPWKSLSLPGLWWWWLWWWWCRVGGECYYYVSRDRDDTWSEEQHQDEFCGRLTDQHGPRLTFLPIAAHHNHHYSTRTASMLRVFSCPLRFGGALWTRMPGHGLLMLVGKNPKQTTPQHFLGLQRCLWRELNLKPLPMAVQLLIGVRVWSGLCSCLRIPRTIAQAPY